MVEWCIYCNPNDSASIYSDEQSMHVRLGPSGPGRSHVASSKKSFVYVCLYHALCAFMLRGVRYIHMYRDLKRPQLRALEEKYGAGRTVNLPIESFGSGASALIGECELRRDLMPLWQSGSESYKSGLHISL